MIVHIVLSLIIIIDKADGIPCNLRSKISMLKIKL